MGQKISDNLLIAAFPAVAYGIAYCFEMGFLQSFNLPSFLISVSFERFASAAIILTVFSLMVVGFGDSITKFSPKAVVENWTVFIPLLFFSYVIAIYIFNFEEANNKLLHISIIFCFMMFLILTYGLPFLISKKDKISYFDAYRNYNRPTEKEEHHLMNVLFKKWGYGFVAYVYLVAFFIPLIIGAGYFSTQGRGQYLVLDKGDKSYAFIRSYSDLSIMVEIQKIWISLYQYEYFFGRDYLLLNELPDNEVFRKENIVN